MKWNVVAYVEHADRYDFSVEAPSAEEAEAQVQAIIDFTDDLSGFFTHACEPGVPEIDTAQTEPKEEGGR